MLFLQENQQGEFCERSKNECWDASNFRDFTRFQYKYSHLCGWRQTFFWERNFRGTGRQRSPWSEDRKKYCTTQKGKEIPFGLLVRFFARCIFSDFFSFLSFEVLIFKELASLHCAMLLLRYSIAQMPDAKARP